MARMLWLMNALETVFGSVRHDAAEVSTVSVWTLPAALSHCGSVGFGMGYAQARHRRRPYVHPPESPTPRSG
ncbi:MAG: hypothetical protein ACOYKM_14715 [Caulobacterales bacterium]|jgi:hypothetical protein